MVKKRRVRIAFVQNKFRNKLRIGNNIPLIQYATGSLKSNNTTESRQIKVYIFVF